MFDQQLLEDAITFIEGLAATPLLMGDDIEMRLEDVQEHARIEAASLRKRMADRANRPSLTEDEREQVRREALEEAAVICDARICEQSRKQADFYAGAQDRLGELSHARHCEAFEIGITIRTLADRSELRQEKEGKA